MEDLFPFATCPSCKHGLLGTAFLNAVPLLFGVGPVHCPCCAEKIKLARLPQLLFLVSIIGFGFAVYLRGLNLEPLFRVIPAEASVLLPACCALIMGLVFVKFNPVRRKTRKAMPTARMCCPV